LDGHTRRLEANLSSGIQRHGLSGFLYDIAIRIGAASFTIAGIFVSYRVAAIGARPGLATVTGIATIGQRSRAEGKHRCARNACDYSKN